MIVFDISI